jgi:hypothetical protein
MDAAPDATAFAPPGLSPDLLTIKLLFNPSSLLSCLAIPDVHSILSRVFDSLTDFHPKVAQHAAGTEQAAECKDRPSHGSGLVYLHCNVPHVCPVYPG